MCSRLHTAGSASAGTMLPFSLNSATGRVATGSTCWAACTGPAPRLARPCSSAPADMVATTARTSRVIAPVWDGYWAL